MSGQYRLNLLYDEWHHGIALYNNKDFVGAIAKLNEAITLSPKYKSAKDNLALATVAQANIDGNKLYKAGDIAGAKEKYAIAVAADPTNVGAKANLANAEAELLEKAGDLAGALVKRQAAVSFAPDNPGLKQKLDETQAALTAAEAKKAEDEKNKK